MVYHPPTADKFIVPVFLSESHWEIRKINNPVIRLSFFLSSFVTTFVCRENKLENAFLSLFIDEYLSFIFVSFVCSFIRLFVLSFVSFYQRISFVCLFFLLFVFRLFVCSFFCLFLSTNLFRSFVFRLFVHSFVCSFFLLSLFINESLPFVPSFGTWLHSVFRVVLKGACTSKSFRSRERGDKPIKSNENQFILKLDFTRFILTLFTASSTT